MSFPPLIELAIRGYSKLFSYVCATQNWLDEEVGPYSFTDLGARAIGYRSLKAVFSINKLRNSLLPDLY